MSARTSSSVWAATSRSARTRACGPRSSSRIESAVPPRVRSMEGHDVLGLGELPTLYSDAVPGAPGAIELADVGELIVDARGGVPAIFHPVADELEEARPSPHLD